jgi:hypothetical protein
MLDKIKKQAGEKEAMDLLDTLRSLRQMSGSLRMVYTGSIGLHHVISSLRQAGYANTPLNDMKREEVPPLSVEAGGDLACRLMEGECIEAADPIKTGRNVAEAVDGIPYFIHHVVGQAARDERQLTPGGIDEIVLDGLTHSMDAWDMRHYRERLDLYFNRAENPVALKTLDIVAHTDEAVGFAELYNLLKAELTFEDEELVRQVLVLLKNDHYLDQDHDGRYAFKFPLIKRWWKLERGI